ncbi:hypothetical protein L1I79_38200 [Strepomyces sp. STD 3.1]|nr:hypothetical protein [Streptomyces sp. STD 3.1]
MLKKYEVGERPTIRFKEKERQQIQDLINLYQRESISKVTIADVVRYAIDNLHETKFPDREDDEDDYDGKYD